MSEEKEIEQSLKAGAQEDKQDGQHKQHGHQHHSEKEIEKLKHHIEELKKQREEYEDAYKRKAAEFENYKKKVLADSERNRLLAAKDIVMQIIPVADNFERAMKSSEETKNFDALVEGLKITHSEIAKILASYQVQPIEAVGKEFDPYLHEAVFMEEREDVEFPQTVVEEFEKGYTMGDLVIRHSKVKVGRKIEKTPADNN